VTRLKAMKNQVQIKADTKQFVSLEQIRAVLSGRDCLGKSAGIRPEDNDQFEQSRLAAVLMPIIEVDDQLCLLFTRRTETVADHRGQVSFPGGSREPGDINLVDTAMRETWEELGIPASEITTLGCLEPRRLVSGFLVTPVIGLINWPIELKIFHPEVARVFKIPLNWLADPMNRYLMDHEYNGMNYQVTYYQPYLGEVVWGATASMTMELLDLIGSSIKTKTGC